MYDVSAPGWRETLDRHLAALLDDLTAHVAREIESGVRAERERANAESDRADTERDRANSEAARAAFAESQLAGARAELETARSESEVAAGRQREHYESLLEQQRIENEAARESERMANEAARESDRVTNESARERERLDYQTALELERVQYESARERQRADLTAALESAQQQAHLAQNAEHAAQEQLRQALDERVAAEQAARRALSESLNQVMRRLRQTTADDEVIGLLLESTAGLSDRAVVLVMENNQAHIALVRGSATEAAASGDAAEISLRHNTVPLGEAPALASCVETRDPLVTMLSAAELSPAVVDALGGPDSGRAYLFPIALRQITVALLIASGNVTPAPIELLCEAAGLKLETLEAAEPAAAPDEPQSGLALVQIATPAQRETSPAVPAPKPESAPITWSKLTPEQQALHLRAQRNARVRVAQIRISESGALRSGALAGNIYDAVRPSLDAARQEFQKHFMSQSPTMVDYLHLEILRSLAHDDIRLLGSEYPGPLV
jgi:hypothetical protein